MYCCISLILIHYSIRYIIYMHGIHNILMYICINIILDLMYGKPGMLEQPRSARTALFLRILSCAFLLALQATTIY